MKKNNSIMKHRRRAIAGFGLINTMIVLALIMLFAGPVLFLGSLLLKIFAFMLLMGIIPYLFSGNSRNKGPLMIFTLVLIALIFFKRSYIIPSILIALIALKYYGKWMNKPSGNYKYYNSSSNYNSKQDATSTSSYRNSSYDRSRGQNSSYTEPKDPFSFRKRDSEIIDVEYEDWEPENKRQTYTNPNAGTKKTMDYSYSGNISKDEGSDGEESEADCCDRGRNHATELEHNKQKVYIGSITKTIHQDSLNVGDNELSFVCKLGDLNLIIDSRLETEINCSIKAGEIRIGGESSSGFNQNVKRSWSPTKPSNKRLKLNCEVGLGEIRIRHKNLY